MRRAHSVNFGGLVWLNFENIPGLRWSSDGRCQRGGRVVRAMAVNSEHAVAMRPREAPVGDDQTQHTPQGRPQVAKLNTNADSITTRHIPWQTRFTFTSTDRPLSPYL